MKKINISISYDEEKLHALRLYLEQKGQTVEGELTAAAEVLYHKTVPTGVREFLDLRSGTPAKPAEKKKKSVPSDMAASAADGGNGD